MFELVFPAIFLGVGVLLTFFRDKSAFWFCRAGKELWSKSTFGLTDMRAFYQEESAKKVFRLMGPLFLCVGLVFTYVSILSFSGPGMFCAMREARTYLESKYGDSGTWKVSSSPAAPDGSVDVSYHYAKRSGRLRAVWQNDHYVFVELPTK